MSTNMLPEAVTDVLDRMARESQQEVIVILGDQVLYEADKSLPNLPEGWERQETGAVTIPGLPGAHFVNYLGFPDYGEPMSEYTSLHRFNLNRLFALEIVFDRKDFAMPAMLYQETERRWGKMKVPAGQMANTWVYSLAVQTEEDVRQVFDEHIRPTLR